MPRGGSHPPCWLFSADIGAVYHSQVLFMTASFQWILFSALIFILHSTAAYPNQSEHWYQDVWCRGMKGQVEYRLQDSRRIDCLTETHAIEVEFAHKWNEAIGQSLDYSMLTGKAAGIVLIVKKKVTYNTGNGLIEWFYIINFRSNSGNSDLKIRK